MNRSIASTYQIPASRFEKMVVGVHSLPRWMAIALGILFVALPFVIAYLEGNLTTVFRTGGWHTLVDSPVIIIYSLAVAPLLLQSQAKIVEGIRPVVRLDDDDFKKLVTSTGRIRPRSELAAIGVGIVIGFIVGRPERLLAEPDALTLYAFLMGLVEFGLIAWWLFIAFANTRLTAALHRQPLDVDIFNPTPFEPIGQQSLVLAVLFIGGISIGLLISYDAQNFLSWQNLVVYPVLIVLAVLLFVLNMRHTHTVLAQTKRRDLAEAEQYIVHAYHTMKKLAAQGAETQAVAGDINAWVAIEQRLKLTRTWPYNTEMLRTLFITSLMPLAVGLSRLMGVLITSGRL